MLTNLNRMILGSLMLIVLAGCGASSSDDDQQTGDVSNIEASNTAYSGEGTIVLEDNSTVCELSELDDNMLVLINEARSVARMWGSTHYEAVSPVKWNCTLKTAASNHSLDMGLSLLHISEPTRPY